MAEKNYALILNNKVVNMIIFDNPTIELINIFKSSHGVDEIIEANKYAVINGTYDGEKFWLPQPYPSWIKNQETNNWDPPVPKPIVEEGTPNFYIWDEETVCWILPS